MVDYLTVLERGSNPTYTLDNHNRVLTLKLPDNSSYTFRNTLPYSLYVVSMATEMARSRKELILPSDPNDAASYLLLFRPRSAEKLRNSLLIRITDNAQDFSVLANHPDIDALVKELREIYDNRNYKRLEVDLPDSKQVSGLSYSKDPGNFAFDPEKKQTFHIITPDSDFNLAHEFEGVLHQHGVIETLENDGPKKLERIVFDNLQIAQGPE